MLPPNNAYWKNRHGRDYQKQQRFRKQRGNRAYELQERWLSQYLVEKRAALGRPLRLLDFGCGFGRIARLVARFKGVEYTGYDFSAAMAEPLLSTMSACGAGDLAPRVLVGEDPTSLLGQSRFDIVLTISVLIHNDEAQTRALLSTMGSFVAEGGQMVLIENAIVGATQRISGWHAGCWMHDLLAYADGEWDVAVYPDAVPPHGVYLLSRKGGERSVFTVIGNDGSRQQRTRQEITRLHGVPPSQEETAWEAAELIGLCRDACELRDAEQARTKRLVQLLTRARKRYQKQALSLAQASMVQRDQSAELAELRAKVKRLATQMQTATRVRQILKNQERGPVASAKSEARANKQHQATEPLYVFDAPRDTQWAQPTHSVFADVLAVFNQQWVGIRAAVGGFPVAKLALSARAELGAEHIKEIAAEARERGIRRVLVHGFSDPMSRSLPALKEALDGVPFYGVWHGSLAAWALDHERDLAARYLRLATSGVFHRIHFMRTGAHVVHRKAWPHVLPNMPPNVRLRRIKSPFQRRPYRALFPSWNNTWKNLYTNIYAATASGAIDNVLTYSTFDMPYFDGQTHVTQVDYGSRADHFATLSDVDLCLNATIVDCHPMVELEAMAVDTPTLRSSLDLDFDKVHPYAALMTVDSPHDVAGIAKRIEHIASVPSEEMLAMLRSYRDLVTSTSLERYADFLEV